MVLRTLVQTIEDSSDKLASSFIRRVKEDPKIVHLAQFPESELRNGAHDVLKNLGSWLVAGREGEIAHRYEALGRRRCEEDVPLHEVVRCLHTLREMTLDFIRAQGIQRNAVELYAEEELEHLVGLFFDGSVYHAVHGYETAMRPEVHA